MLAQTNYFQNAHRLSSIDVDSSVTDVQPGQLFQLNDSGKWVYADGTRKAYPTLNSRYSGTGFGIQKELLEGRDDVSLTGKISVLKGNYEIGTDQYDTAATYTYGCPLTASTDPTKKGQITVFDTAATTPRFDLIIGYCTHVPADANDMIRYEG